MKFKRSELTISPMDQCYRCPVRDVCPLLDALTQGVALMAQESIHVDNCYLFARSKKNPLPQGGTFIADFPPAPEPDSVSLRVVF